MGSTSKHPVRPAAARRLGGGRQRRAAVPGRPGRRRRPDRRDRPAGRRRGWRNRHRRGGRRAGRDRPLPDARVHRRAHPRRRAGRQHRRSAGRAPPGRHHRADRPGRAVLRACLEGHHRRGKPVLRRGQRALPGRAGRRLLNRGRAGPLRREHRAERGLPGPGRHHPRRGAGLLRRARRRETAHRDAEPWSSRRWKTARSACPAGWSTSRAGSPTPPSWPRCAPRWPRPARCT